MLTFWSSQVVKSGSPDCTIMAVVTGPSSMCGNICWMVSVTRAKSMESQFMAASKPACMTRCQSSLYTGRTTCRQCIPHRWISTSRLDAPRPEEEKGARCIGLRVAGGTVAIAYLMTNRLSYEQLTTLLRIMAKRCSVLDIRQLSDLL